MANRGAVCQNILHLPCFFAVFFLAMATSPDRTTTAFTRSQEVKRFANKLLRIPAQEACPNRSRYHGALKQRPVRKVTEAMASVEGETLREKTVVVLEEVKSGDRAVGRKTLSANDVKRLRARS